MAKVVWVLIQAAAAGSMTVLQRSVGVHKEGRVDLRRSNLSYETQTNVERSSESSNGSGRASAFLQRISGSGLPSRGESALVLVFWGALWNVLYWMPPGVFSWCRVPVLWPHTPEDNDNWLDFPMDLWAAMVFSGVFGMACTFLVGVTLKYFVASTYVLLVSPLVLLSSVASEYFVWEQPLDFLSLLGVGAILAGFAIDTIVSVCCPNSVSVAH